MTAASDGPICSGPVSGLIDAAALHFVVVLPDDPVLGRDVRVREELQKSSC